MKQEISRAQGFPSSIWIQMALGAVAGFIASGPMGLWMLAMQRLFPKAKQEQLPPEQITMELTRRIGIKEHIDQKPERTIATWISHFGYGAVIGSLYPLLARRVRAPVYLKGMLFGLIVWAGSYLGWVPAANVLPSATEHSWQRNTLMISAHLLWGSLISLFITLTEYQE